MGGLCACNDVGKLSQHSTRSQLANEFVTPFWDCFISNIIALLFRYNLTFRREPFHLAISPGRIHGEMRQYISHSKHLAKESPRQPEKHLRPAGNCHLALSVDDGWADGNIRPIHQIGTLLQCVTARGRWPINSHAKVGSANA